MTFSEVIRGIIAGRRGYLAEDVPQQLWVERPRRPEKVAADYPHFRTSATDRADEAGVAETRLRLRDAFIVSQPVASRSMLAGRVAILQHLIGSVEDERAHIVLHGERGIGKTSLLRVFTQIARQAGYLVIYENCRATSRFADLFRSIAGQIPLRYHGNLDTIDIQAREGGSLADLLPREQLSPAQLCRALTDIVATRSIIILDEFDRVEDAEFKRDVAELIKDLSDSSARVQLVVAGVAANLQDLLGYAPSIRRNIRGICVHHMSDAEIDQIIAIGERHAGIGFDQAARQAIVQLALGLPFVARLLAHYASFTAVEAGRNLVNANDVRTAIGRSAELIEGQLSPDARTIARAALQKDPELAGRLGQEALSNGGIVVAPQAKGQSGGAPEVLALLAEPARPDGQSGAAPETAAQTRCFSEDGLALYLHLQSSLAKLSAHLQAAELKQAR